MNAKSFIILLVMLGVLGGLAVLQQKQAKPGAQPAGAGAERLLDPARLNDIARFTLSSGTQSVTLARSNDRWVVESLWNYPADFDRVADRLRQLATIEPGEIVRGGETHLDEFGLTPDATNDVGARGSQLVLQDSAGKTIRTLALGFMRPSKSMAPFGSSPNTSYARVNDGPVQLIAAYFGDWPTATDAWINRNVLQVPPTSVVAVAVSLTNGTTYRATRTGDADFRLEGLGENEATRPDTVRGLFSALQGLWVSSVENPALGPETTGLDRPDTYTATADDGMSYTLNTGLHSPTYGRYAKIFVSYQKPAPPAADAQPAPTVVTNETGAVVTNAAPDLQKLFEEKAAADAQRAESLNAQFSPWIYVLNESDCQTLLMPREQLVTNIAPVEAQP